MSALVTKAFIHEQTVELIGSGCARQHQVHTPAFLKAETEIFDKVFDEKDKEIYSKYEKEAKKINNLVLAGRLGNYKYYNMDKAIEEAMNTFKML